MRKLSVEIDDKALNQQIKKALRKNPQETVRAVRACALDLAGESAKRAPIESGDLRSNCHADLNGIGIFANQKPTGASPVPSVRATATVGYSLPYALRQHEDLSLRHDRTDGRRIMSGKYAGQTVNMVAGGEPKYLERPFDERVDKYIAHVKKIVERSLR